MWPRVGRYAFAIGVGALVGVGGAVERLDGLPESQQDTAYAVVALDLVLGLVSLALLPLRRRHPLGVACTIVALLSVSSASFGSALVAIVSMGTWRRRPWAVLTGGVFLTGRSSSSRSTCRRVRPTRRRGRWSPAWCSPRSSTAQRR